MQTFFSIGMLILGATLAICGAVTLGDLPAIPTATFPQGFTAAHFIATGWLLVGSFGMFSGVVTLR